jgi:hypothetical protein
MGTSSGSVAPMPTASGTSSSSATSRTRRRSSRSLPTSGSRLARRSVSWAIRATPQGRRSCTRRSTIQPGPASRAATVRRTNRCSPRSIPRHHWFVRPAGPSKGEWIIRSSVDRSWRRGSAATVDSRLRGNDECLDAGSNVALWEAAMSSSGPGALELYCHEVTVRFVERAVVPPYEGSMIRAPDPASHALSLPLR